MLATLGLGVLKFFMGETAGKLIDGVTGIIKNKTDAITIDNQTGANLGMSYLNAVNETNRLKVEGRTERQVMWGLFGFALPTMVVWWLALMDGVPWNLSLGLFELVHRKGSWGVAIPPAFEADFHTIVQSFFVAAPALAGVAMLAKVFRR